MSREGIQLAAGLAAVGLSMAAACQLPIALGAPVGRASWGGSHEGALPTNLRFASVFAAVARALAALIILGRADLEPLSDGYLRRAWWVIVGTPAVGTPMNAASKSLWERFGWAPFTVVLAVLCAIVASR